MAGDLAAAEHWTDRVHQHLYLVQHVVNELAARFPRHIDRGDLWSAGALGLVEAAQRYDETMETPFPRYAVLRIRGAMIDSSRTRDWATRSLRRIMRAARDAAAQFEDRQARPPTTAELAGLLGVEVSELERRQAAAAQSVLLHLDRTDGDEDGGGSLSDKLREDDPDWQPEEALERRELVGTLHTAVAHLPSPQREVVERSYFRGELLREIAASLGLTEARVSQIRSEALAAMRSYFATGYHGVPAVPHGTPGVRSRAAYVAALAAGSTWRSRLEAADQAMSVAVSGA